MLDEGAKNVATNLARVFGRTDELLAVYQRTAWHPKNLLAARKFKPDIILSVHGPSIKTIILLFLFKVICASGKTVVVAAQPHDDPVMLMLASWLKPDHIFAQSEGWKFKFGQNGRKNVHLLPNGVDNEKFRPCQVASALAKTRQELGLGEDDKIILHIGPINNNRNHELLIRIAQETDWKVIVIGSTTAPFEPELFEKIKESGAIAINRYFPDINRLYSIANYYIFPVMDQTGSIEFPLTVLEAMSCNCPVLTTKFRGIPDFLKESEGLRYFFSFEEVVEILDTELPEANNREIALSYSWEKIAETILQKVTGQL